MSSAKMLSAARGVQAVMRALLQAKMVMSERQASEIVMRAARVKRH